MANYVFETTAAAQPLTFDGFIAASNIMPDVNTPAPAPSGPGITASISGILDNVHMSHLQGASIDVATPTRLVLNGLLGTADLVGTGFTYDFNEQLIGGTVTQLTFQELGVQAGIVHARFSGMAFSAAPLGGWVATDATQTAFAAMLAGDDTINGSFGVDLLRGYDGSDLISGFGGHDTIWGGNGDDTISAILPPGSTDTGQGQTYLRGEAGNDRIVGSSGFDDAHGNTGDDTVSGGGFDDWVVGGQGNDVLFGDDGSDLCYGQLGSDTIDGGPGDDAVVGGQANDVLFGGDGNDFITGDRGDDILIGGLGADTFHTNNVSGIDRVNDFNQAQGDKVLVDVGSTYTLSQVGANVVIDMGGGNQMVLVGVFLSSLTAGWITGG